MLSDANLAVRPFRTCLLASALVFAGASADSPAFASTPYDGTWSVAITTRVGACEPTVRYGVQILNGAVADTNGSEADVRGHVSGRGIVKVSVRSGGAWAVGSGRLEMESGSGTWSGEGSSGACEGTWVAERRGPAGETSSPGSIYSYAPGTDAPEMAGPGLAACERFRSYDPATGTYLGHDGVRHACR